MATSMPKPQQRQLLPTLPAEIRNLIYSYTSDPAPQFNSITSTSTGSNAFLPFSVKTYDSSHTKVCIYPSHHGNNSLLALQQYGFFEAKEYQDYVFTHSSTLMVSVHFKGHLNTFVQQHWDDKMTAHLHKLVKKYPWFARAPKLDVQIFWDPKLEDRAAKTKNDMVTIVNRMVEVLSQAQAKHVREKKAELRVGLHLPRHLVVERRTLQNQGIGMHDFLTARACPHYEIREVMVAKREPVIDLQNYRWVDIPPLHEKEKTFIQMNRHGHVTWSDGVWGLLVMRESYEGDANDARRYTQWTETEPGDKVVEMLMREYGLALAIRSASLSLPGK